MNTGYETYKYGDWYWTCCQTKCEEKQSTTGCCNMDFLIHFITVLKTYSLVIIAYPVYEV